MKGKDKFIDLIGYLKLPDKLSFSWIQSIAHHVLLIALLVLEAGAPAIVFFAQRPFFYQSTDTGFLRMCVLIHCVEIKQCQASKVPWQKILGHHHLRKPCR